jgi:lipopolysaccharide export LptBFGC system permease protein LptF
MLLGMGLYILADLLLNLDEFTKDTTLSGGQVLALMLDYYGHNLPLYFSQLGGPMTAIAATFTLGTMLRNNELTALVAAGMPLQRLAAPLMVCSVVTVALWVANQEILVAGFGAKIARSHDDMAGGGSVGVNSARDDNNAILWADRFYPRAGKLFQVKIAEPPGPDHTRNLITADSAEYDAERQTWTLDVGRRVMTSPAPDSGLGAGVRTMAVYEYPFTLTPDELVLRRGATFSQLLSLRQMNSLLQSRMVVNRLSIEMGRHVRLTQPLLQWTLLLLAVPFFLTREPCSVLAAGGRAMLLTGAFLALAFVAHSIVQSEAAAALLAWLPILIFGPVAVLQLANVKT